MPSEAAPPVRKYKYRLQFVPSAWAEWQKLDGSVKEPMRRLLKKRLDNPHVPGAALHGALAGHYKIKLNKQGYRLVYGVQDDVLIVMVMAVDKREDSVVYQSAMARVSEKMAALADAAHKRLKQ
ncbi:type II toxin-antitoxin system mRNA interferase toxin, RelE/StbE family [Rhodoferax lacus]|uniref:Type II toxin-antitoxin system mRNA interferase toxin, RelE/StbE family n=1 Tax=Rhodoferax lacus TaxID=2184758 RepID=A0A3E1R8C4_9BURK|nr:type II toxin-antitoxin system RelE/ParE family toxin [Rhodoferax lacus]RFO95615.1 type II toxin-antitoxin system mRNA interferase toxin, RelE/StbE family [Rhodoferax lacus]